MDIELEKYLAGFLTPSRKQLLESVLSQRMGHVAVILEDIYDPHNANAVIRTAEALGVQHIYVIENHNKFQLSHGVTRGAFKWVTISRFRDKGQDNISQCFSHVKEQGYRILAAMPQDSSVIPEEIPIEQPVALLFGSEQNGISRQALDLADGTFSIPMTGFTTSLNISVSAGVALYLTTSRVRRSIPDWGLSQSERASLMGLWVRGSLKQASLYEREFYVRLKK